MRIYTNLLPFIREIESLQIKSGRDLVRRVGELGFDGVELNLRILEHPAGRRLLEGLDCSRVSFHSHYEGFNLGIGNRYIREAGIRQLADELRLARARGVRLLTFHPGLQSKYLSREQALDNVAHSLEQVLAAAGAMQKPSPQTAHASSFRAERGLLAGPLRDPA
jgi:sugar phosphate isomerase/epimerase